MRGEGTIFRIVSVRQNMINVILHISLIIAIGFTHLLISKSIGNLEGFERVKNLGGGFYSLGNSFKINCDFRRFSKRDTFGRGRGG